MKGASYFALGVGLLTETAIALGQTPSQTLVAQVTGSVPPSGVLITPPAAPVAVPPSGALATVDRPAVTAVPFTTIRKLRTAGKGSSVRSGRQVRHRRPSAGREATARSPTTAQSIIVAPTVVKSPTEQPRDDGIIYGSFLSQFGKGKE